MNLSGCGLNDVVSDMLINISFEVVWRLHVSCSSWKLGKWLDLGIELNCLYIVTKDRFFFLYFFRLEFYTELVNLGGCGLNDVAADMHNS